MRALFGDRVSSLEMTRQVLINEYFKEPVAWRDYHKARFEPVIVVYNSIGDNPEQVAALDQDLADFTNTWNRGEPGGGAVFEQEYLLVKARRSG